MIDAVEVRPVTGAPVSTAAACTLATEDKACGALGACMFGHCVDSALIWGPVPQALDHRTDLVARWAFTTQSLLADRKATAAAVTSFAGAAANLSGETSPRAYYGALNQLVAGVRDSHTTLGVPPSTTTVFYPLSVNESGPMDVCLGLAQDDVGGTGSVFAVFGVGANPSISETLAVGDVLTAVDGMAPDAWLAAVAPRYLPARANDPAADPSQLALALPELLGRFATTVGFSRCHLGGGCAPQPEIPVAAELLALIKSSGGTKGYSLSCSLRFHNAVSTWAGDGSAVDVPQVQTVGLITSVELDGFEGAYDASQANPYAAWEDPMISAFSGGANVLVDARLGHGGKNVLGSWLYQRLRGSDQPYTVFAMPRGAYDDPDPAWLFSAAFGACENQDYDPGADLCAWTGDQGAVTANPSPAGAASKIAWVNGDDVSNNDIVPRFVQGRTNLVVFGPHPTHGAYGEISHLPPIEPTWAPGSIQVLDMRFGATYADALAAPWASGTGVAPDQIVVQTVSDLLSDKDTVLAAAQTWLLQ